MSEKTEIISVLVKVGTENIKFKVPVTIRSVSFTPVTKHSNVGIDIEYIVENEAYVLEPGDSLLFAAHLPHRWRNPGSKVTNALIILSGFLEDELPHAMHWKKSETEDAT